MADLNPYAQAGAALNDDLHVRTIGVAGMERSYWSATRQPRGEDVPLLIAVHDAGMAGHHMAKLTGLAERAAELGFHVVFPDALERYWDDHGTGRRDRADDSRFMTALVDLLRKRGEVSSAPVFMTGLGNGAYFTELVARSAAVDLSGFALVSGTARVASRDLIPLPRQSASVLVIHGANDRTVARGEVSGRSVRKRGAGVRGRRSLLDIRGHQSVPLELLRSDWKQANVDSDQPVRVRVVAGKGDGWPGGRGSLISQITPRASADRDATAMVLEFAQQSLADAPVSQQESLESPHD